MCPDSWVGRAKVRASNPGGGEIFRPRPDLSWVPPSLLYSGYGIFPGVKRPGRGVDHPPPCSAEVKERVELYISGPSWPVAGWTLPLPYADLRSGCQCVWSFSDILAMCIYYVLPLKFSLYKILSRKVYLCVVYRYLGYKCSAKM